VGAVTFLGVCLISLCKMVFEEDVVNGVQLESVGYLVPSFDNLNSLGALSAVGAL
jgi:hypothetical protein